MSKIAILTNFMEFNPGYSLTGIVQDQVRMLLSYGHEVHVYVNAQYNRDKYPAMPEEDFDRYSLDREKYKVVPEIPFAHLIDYRKNELTDDHKKTVADTAEMLVRKMVDYDFVFTHDFVFTGWFLPYGMGCQRAGKSEQLQHLRWFHWIHSVPTANSDWWDIRAYGSRHKIVYPNRTDAIRVAEQYKGPPEAVRVIPHIKDPRSWWDFDKTTCDFLKEFPEVMSADVLQVYPASTDRLTPKRVAEVLIMFGEIKRRGLKAYFILANQWATGTQRKEDVTRYMKKASRSGLKWQEDYIFTSEWREEMATGIPKVMLRELLLLSNLFIFPTREESFGLVGPEAGLSGLLLVNNKSLDMMAEVNGLTGLYMDFGSFHNTFEPPNKGEYLRQVTSLILGRMQRNESIMSKTWHRKTYNWDAIYRKYYEPIMAESVLWA